MNNGGWDFGSAFAVASGVIPTLLLALVVESRLLNIAVEEARAFRRAIDKLPRWVKWLSLVRPWADPRLIAWVNSPKGVITICVLAEVVALTGVAVPSAWLADGFGRFLGFVGLTFVGWAVLILLLHVASALLVVANEAEKDEKDEKDPVSESASLPPPP